MLSSSLSWVTVPKELILPEDGDRSVRHIFIQIVDNVQGNTSITLIFI